MLDGVAHPVLGLGAVDGRVLSPGSDGLPQTLLVLGTGSALVWDVADLIGEADVGPVTVATEPTLDGACRRLAERPALAVVVDVTEPGTGGLTGLVRLQAASPGTLVVPTLGSLEPHGLAPGDPWRLDRAALAACLRDAVGRLEGARRLYRLATEDPLTGLPNRNLLFDRLGRALARARRTGVGGALLFLDLDGFKDVNDRFGHDAGDRVLVEVARRLRGAVRATDTVARYGGDEFVVLLEDAVTDAERLKPLIDALRARVAEPVNLDDRPAAVRASVGVVLFPGETDDPAALLRRADRRMYEAKAAARRAVC